MLEALAAIDGVTEVAVEERAEGWVQVTGMYRERAFTYAVSGEAQAAAYMIKTRLPTDYERGEF